MLRICGCTVGHPFKLYLAIQQIQYRRTDIGSPETNGFCERLHRAVKEEFYAVAFRRTLTNRWSNCGVTSMSIWRSTIANVRTKATARKAARRNKPF